MPDTPDAVVVIMFVIYSCFTSSGAGQDLH
jgi:predicted small secreted protein